MFDGQKDAFQLDSTYQTISITPITAIQAKDHDRALKLLKERQ